MTKYNHNYRYKDNNITFWNEALCTLRQVYVSISTSFLLVSKHSDVFLSLSSNTHLQNMSSSSHNTSLECHTKMVQNNEMHHYTFAPVTNSSFHELVPDCRKLIFSFHLHEILHEINPDAHGSFGFNRRKTAAAESKSITSETASDLQFALNHFKCQGKFTDVELCPLENLYSLELIGVGIPPYQELSNMSPTFKNLVELKINRGGIFHDEMFRHMESLEVLSIAIGPDCLTDELFTYLKHLKHLNLAYCCFTDEAFENMYNAGSRLEKLAICGCTRITDRVTSFLDSGHLKELSFRVCWGFTGDGLQNLRGLQRLSLNGVKNINCHESFKCLEGSVQHLSLSGCACLSLDEKATSYLKGISTLELHRCDLRDLTDEAFGNMTSNIKRLELKKCKGVERLSKNMLWHLSGIEQIQICDTNIRIEAEDLPHLKQVFRSVSRCEVSEDFADDAILKQLRQYIESNGGKFLLRAKIPYGY